MGAITLSTFVDVAQGVCRAGSLTQYKRMEDSVRTGGNEYLTAAFQCAEVNHATLLTESAVAHLGAPSLPLPLRVVVYITPALLALALKFEVVGEGAKKVLIFIQDHLGTFCQVISVVSSVALIYFGSIALGATSLTLLALGYLDRAGLLPQRVRHILHEYTLPALTLAGIIDGSVIGLIQSGLYIALKCASLYIEYQESAQVKEVLSREIKGGALSFQDLEDLIAGTVQTEINREYINYEALPPAPNCDIDLLNQLFAQIDWQKNNKQHMVALREKLARDPVFRKREGDPAQKTDQYLIDYVKKNLADFVTSVKTQYMPNGEIRDYAKLDLYLKIEANALQNEQDEVTKVDALLRLGIEAGGYCGPGRYNPAEELFAFSVEGMSGLPLRTRVLNNLQTLRNRWFGQFYTELSEMMNKMVMGKVLDMQDVHTYNQIANMYGHTLGLRKAGADNDTTAVVEPLVRVYLAWYLGGAIEKAFWQAHTQEAIVDAISEAISEGILDTPRVSMWWNDWVQNLRGVNPQGAEQIEDSLADIDNGPTILGEHFEVRRGIRFDPGNPNQAGKQEYNPVLIKAMLVDMGVLKIVRSGNTAERSSVQQYAVRV